jgi:hypothetical protein
VKDSWILRSISILLCNCDMALTLSSRQLNLISAMFFSSEFIKISILSGRATGSKNSISVVILQAYFLRLEAWIIREGGLIDMDLVVLNLQYNPMYLWKELSSVSLSEYSLSFSTISFLLLKLNRKIFSSSTIFCK